MPRLTRTESQERTRAQLIETARRLFFAEGFHATSLEKVAEAAGYSKGAVYSNFRNKDELCAAVLERVRADRFGELLALFTAPDQDTRLAAFGEWAEQVIGDPGWTSLELEFAVHSTRSDELRTELAARADSVVGMLAGALGGMDDVSWQLPESETALILLALGVGLGMLRTVDPAVPVRGIVDATRLLAIV
ncbi:TetR/AcrR family transcriptional regulator [Skermania piniformis]|uniref:TetR/AcrR family transcriptional regulator n=1 Tax=Skermania pinensis TaxID=39122 RepID=A0ABX8SCF7_9ACTN|nr:TetR/AcrR family transcriptional regulator [Skermania piniformis]QXQ15478.1 TetR/AcrR family transcriptional regulator [Skermania piniformis]